MDNILIVADPRIALQLTTMYPQLLINWLDIIERPEGGSQAVAPVEPSMQELQTLGSRGTSKTCVIACQHDRTGRILTGQYGIRFLSVGIALSSDEEIEVGATAREVHAIQQEQRLLLSLASSSNYNLVTTSALASQLQTVVNKMMTTDQTTKH